MTGKLHEPSARGIQLCLGRNSVNQSVEVAESLLRALRLFLSCSGLLCKRHL
jgi:hypothetical protein